MNRSEIIAHLEKLALPKSEYWVLAGSALVLHGIKEETRDIDLGCTTALFQALKEKGCKLKMMSDGSQALEIDESTEAFENWFADALEEIQGIPVGSLLSIRAHKVKLNREKDFADIQRIDEALSVGNPKLVLKE